MDALAHRYHLLPSEVLSRADVLDYVVLDVAQTYQRQQLDAEQSPRKSTPAIPVNKLEEMIRKVRR